MAFPFVSASLPLICHMVASVMLLTNKTSDTLSLLKTAFPYHSESVFSWGLSRTQKTCPPLCLPHYSPLPASPSLSSEVRLHRAFALYVPTSWKHLSPLCTGPAPFPYSSLSSDTTFPKRLSQPSSLTLIPSVCSLAPFSMACSLIPRFIPNTIHLTIGYTFDSFLCLLPGSRQPHHYNGATTIEELWNALPTAATSTPRIVLDTWFSVEIQNIFFKQMNALENKVA